MERHVVTFRELANSLRSLGISHEHPVIAHASLSAFGAVSGGAEVVVGAMLAVFDRVMMPAFTYKTMLTPEAGPPDNGLDYGSQRDLNRMAEFFEPDMPCDRLIGAVAEAMRRHSLAWRSPHPILSFAGIDLEDVLEAQSLEDPLAPIHELAAQEGYVLLLGVNHTANTSIHYAERLAGRAQFVRWALTPSGAVECPGFPGCSAGFEDIAPDLADISRKSLAGSAPIQAVPLGELLQCVQARIESDPAALLCASPDCLRCQAVRARLAMPGLN